MKKIIGIDLGTMNICTAKQLKDKDVELKSVRNMFLPVDPNQVDSIELSETNLDYVEQKDEDGETEYFAIFGEDSFKFSQIFGKPIRRPMKNGVISPEEIDAIDILTLMIEKLIGRGPGKCVYSIPANSVDVDNPSIVYHSEVFKSILDSLGYESKPLNEALAIIYSECQKENFSGIAFSFGCGMVNCCTSYKGTPVFEFSINRGGDWIDTEVAKSIGVPTITRVTSIKEKKLDLSKLIKSKNKKERRILQALKVYYETLINYVLDHVTDHFNKMSDNLDIDNPIPIIISGGTSMPPGFVDLFKKVFESKKNFPYEISEIRHAKDPLFSVCQGNLLYGLWQQKKEEKKNGKNS